MIRFGSTTHTILKDLPKDFNVPLSPGDVVIEYSGDIEILQQVKYDDDLLSEKGGLMVYNPIEYRVRVLESISNHNFSGEECLVAHFDKQGNALPQCKKCKNCQDWIKHPYNSQCVAKNPKP